MPRIAAFQQEKLEYYFKFFDSNNDGFLEKDDLSGFMKKILDYTGWPENSSAARECQEVHATFFEILKEKTSDNENDNYRVSKTEWIDIWASILPGCMGMYNFPVWLRLLPKSLFKIMDKNGDGVIDKDELEEFYEKMVHIKPSVAKDLSVKAMNDMTDFGRYPLNLHGYEQIFANFLLGRTPYGPGRYIFGCFEHALEQLSKFKLVQGAKNDEKEDDDDTLPDNYQPRISSARRPSMEAYGGHGRRK